MANTDAYEMDQDTPNLAIGYTMPQPEEGSEPTVELALAPLEPNTATLPFKGSPAGGGYSTVGDLTRFHTALWGNELVGAELVERVTPGPSRCRSRA